MLTVERIVERTYKVCSSHYDAAYVIGETVAFHKPLNQRGIKGYPYPTWESRREELAAAYGVGLSDVEGVL